METWRNNSYVTHQVSGHKVYEAYVDKIYQVYVYTKYMKHIYKVYEAYIQHSIWSIHKQNIISIYTYP